MFLMKIHITKVNEEEVKSLPGMVFMEESDKVVRTLFS